MIPRCEQYLMNVTRLSERVSCCAIAPLNPKKIAVHPSVRASKFDFIPDSFLLSFRQYSCERYYLSFVQTPLFSLCVLSAFAISSPSGFCDLSCGLDHGKDPVLSPVRAIGQAWKGLEVYWDVSSGRYRSIVSLCD